MATLTSVGIEGIGLRGTTGIGTLRKVNCAGKMIGLALRN